RSKNFDKMLGITEIFIALVVCLLILHHNYRKLLNRYFSACSPWFIVTNFLLQTLQLTNIYGNIYTLWMGQTPLVVLNGYKAVKDGIVTHSEEVSGRPLTPFYRDMMGIFLTNGHTWKQQRRFGMTIIRSLALGKNNLEHQIQREACHLVDIFTNTEGKPFDPHTSIVHAIANIICAVVFGHCFSSEDESFRNQQWDLTRSAFCLTPQLYDAFPWLMHHLPGPHQEVFAYNDFMHRLVMEEVQAHERQNTDDPQDLIDFYLAQITKTTDDPTSTFNKENMVQTVVDLLLGGTETTSTTLLWALLYMVQYPDIQEKVQREIEAVLEPSHVISYEDRKQLPYTNAVIHEALRYSNVTSVGVPRQCLRSTTLLGFHIKKGTLVLPNLHSVVYDTEHWATPWKFNPDHFLDLDGNFVNKEAFLPFSAGHRVCLGERMARVELFIFFTNLLRAFTFQLPEGVKEINLEYILGAILQPHPYKLCAIPR
uniref:CP2J2 protein n=1 Tax=Zonotrichia albicollis TaxID=44394 RepID=A0A8D2MF97_ZONAL